MIGSLTEWELTDLGKAQADCIGKNMQGFIGDTEYVMISSSQIRAQTKRDKWMSFCRL